MYENEIDILRNCLDKFKTDDIIDCHILGSFEEVIEEIESYSLYD